MNTSRFTARTIPYARSGGDQIPNGLSRDPMPKRAMVCERIGNIPVVGYAIGRSEITDNCVRSYITARLHPTDNHLGLMRVTCGEDSRPLRFSLFRLLNLRDETGKSLCGSTLVLFPKQESDDWRCGGVQSDWYIGSFVGSLVFHANQHGDETWKTLSKRSGTGAELKRGIFGEQVPEVFGVGA